MKGEGEMIRRLYDLEDWLFYRSRSCKPAIGRRVENWSRHVGLLADRLQASLCSHHTT
jgi:hypothetical protein